MSGSKLEKLRASRFVVPLRRVWGLFCNRRASLLRRRRAVKVVSDFILAQETGYRLRLLTQMDPARVMSVIDFQKFWTEFPATERKVAVVSGSLAEPELKTLPPDTEVVLLNFDDDPQLFDLGKDWSGPDYADFQEKFDLVLCEQVLEHVVNPEQAVRNLAQLVKPKGILHLSVPAVNNRHGEPHYFYSGFAPATLEHWLQRGQLRVLRSSSWNSDKGSRMYSTSDWAPLAESGPLVFFLHSVPLLWRFPVELLRVLVRRFRNTLRYPLQPLFPLRDSKNAVAVWCFASLD